MRRIIVNIWERLYKPAFWNTDDGPVRCCNCGSKSLVEHTRAIDGGRVSEFDVTCESCGAYVQEWAYGSYNPYNTRTEPLCSVVRRVMRGADHE